MTIENEKRQDTHPRRQSGRPAGRGRGHGPKGGARRGGRKRPFAHGDLRLLILNIIADTPSHGYGLITEIKTLTSGFYEPSPGVIYPAIEALQDAGWVEVQAEKGKRVLHITKAGKTELAQQSDAITAIKERLKKLTSPDQKLEVDDIRGALQQLRFTTKTVFKGKQSETETRVKAVAILEEARKKIAKLA